jgi:predicted nucleotidyltransferase
MRANVLRRARRYGAANVRVFGSVGRQAASSESDLDLLVDPVPGRFRRLELSLSLRRLLGRRVDIVTEESLPWLIQPQVIAEAVPL